LVVGPGTGRSGSSVDALVGMTDDVLALVVPVIGIQPDDESVSTPEGKGTSVESCGVVCESDRKTVLDGIRPVRTGAVVMVSSAVVIVSGDDGEGSSSVATVSDGIILDVRGAEGISPDGKGFRVDANTFRSLAPTDGASKSDSVLSIR
jgi:hypothetical protein